MKLFTVRLTEEERARLEAFRAARGLRSESDAVRVLIEESVKQLTPTAHSVRSPALSMNAGLTVGPVAPKPGSRLKKDKR